MSIKYTYEIIKCDIESVPNQFLESTEYKNCKTKLKIRCPNNHIYYMCYDKYKNRGYRCSECSGIKKHTYEIVKSFIESDKNSKDGINHKLESTEYINNQTKLKIVCPKGHKFEMCFNDFRSGYRCAECAGLKKPTIEFIKEFSLRDGTICLSNEYINSKTKLSFKCPKDHEYKMNWAHFRKKRRCQKCSRMKMSGENNPSWNPDRTRKSRLKYLTFDLRKRSILKEDPLYDSYIKNKSKYNVDHIFPRVAFIDNDLDIKYDKLLVKQICNLVENLKIITVKQNKKKSGKYNQDEFMDWFNNKINNLNKKEGN